MKPGIKLTGVFLFMLAVAVVVAQSQCYQNQAARKNAMHNDTTAGKSTEELKQRIRDLRKENEKHPAPYNAPVDHP